MATFLRPVDAAQRGTTATRDEPTAVGPSAVLRAAKFCVTLFALVSLMDVLREVAMPHGEPVNWLTSTIKVLGYVVVAAAPWMPLVAAGASLIPLVLVIAHGGGVGVEPMLIMVCVVVTAVRSVRWPLFTLVGAYLAWCAALGVVMGDPIPGWFAAMIVIVSTLAGLGARHFVVERVAERRRVAALEAENQRIRAEERLTLARELHDGIAHALSIIAVQHMAHGASRDPDELQAALERIDRASHTALDELRTLVHVLRQDQDQQLGVTSGPTPGHLVSLVQDVAATVAADLRENGHTPRMCLDPMPDDLDPSVHTTICRLLTEASTNILRYAEPGCPCLFLVRAESDAVHVRVSNPLPGGAPTGSSWQSNGLGLRGLRERVGLTGGQFDAGAIGDQWVVTARIPRS